MAKGNGTEARLKNLEAGQSKIFDKLDKITEELVKTRENLMKDFSHYKIKMAGEMGGFKAKISIFSGIMFLLLSSGIGILFKLVIK